jgi:hypothetical protein
MATGIMGHHAPAPRQDSLDGHEGRRLAHVVGVGLEGQAPHRDGAPGKVLAQAGCQGPEREVLLPIVQCLDGLQNPGIQPFLVHRPDEGLHILGKAGPPVPDPGEEEGGTDAGVAPDPHADLVRTRAPTASQSPAIMFMKEIRVASIALAAYLVISADAMSMIRIWLPVRTKGA